MRLAHDIASGLWAALRETWPSTEEEGAIFLSGMCWAFVLFWGMLLLVTCLYLKTVPGAS